MFTSALKTFFGSGVVATVTDAFFNLVTLLLPGNGTNGAQNNTFLDSSTNNFTITRNDNTTQGTFSPFSQTGWGLRTNDRSYLTIPASGDFDLISTDFTVEFWFNLNAFNTMSFAGNNFFGNGLSTAVNGWTMSFDGSGTTATSVTFGVYNGGSFSSNVFSGLTLNMGTWYQIVLQRNGAGAGNLRLFVNGVLQGSAVNSVTYSTAGSTFTFGSGAYTQNSDYSGNADYFISNVRLTKSAVYSTSGFTSPTSNLSQISGTTLLICQSNRLINNGTNAGAITSAGYSSTIAQVVPFSPFNPTAAYSAATVGGSGYFDGTGDYLAPTANLPAISTGQAFTLEMWVYAPAAVVNTNGAGLFGGISNAINFVIGVPSTNNITYGKFGVANIINPGGACSITPGSWNHLVLCRNTSNQTAIFVNGARVGFEGADTNSFVAATYNIANNNGNFFSGYISSLRFVVGTAVYNPALTTLTVPTAPLTAITNTQLLLNFTNAGIADATAKNVLETVGNASISTTQSKFGGSSMFFDGTGDYLSATPRIQSNAVGSGNATIEMWVYTSNSSSSLKCLVDTRSAQNTDTGFGIYQIANNVVIYGAGVKGNAASQLTGNTWVHLAVTRANTTNYVFIGGTLYNTFSYGNTLTSSNVTIASDVAGSNAFTGYIDDLRITKGVARYTANFTPTTTAFPLQ